MNRYYILTLGCQMNISDSQRIATKLESFGYRSASEKGADLVVVNACSVRQRAVDRIWGLIKKWQKDQKRILITGCILDNDRKKFDQKNVATFKITELPNLQKILTKHSQILKNMRIIGGSEEDNYNLQYFKINPKIGDKIIYIPIMTGCDNFCSYCAVPYTRGREISRPLKDIVKDIKNALKNGHKELLLLGQNVNSYGIKKSNDRLTFLRKQNSNTTYTGGIYSDNSSNSEFIKLLKEIDQLPYNFQFNFISSNPHDMTDELIDTLANLKKWPRELHLPMQSGDDEILKKMNRKYTSSQFLALISKLKYQMPNINISTDIIVGFSGETKKQFENTVKICQKIGFTKAYISQYSPRPGTAAAKLKDDVSREEKKRRWLVLDNLINH